MSSLPKPLAAELNSADELVQSRTLSSSGEEEPPPPPQLCTECVAPDGHHYFTTVSGCIANGGTPYGEPFPCPDTQTGRQSLAAKMGLPLK